MPLFDEKMVELKFNSVVAYSSNPLSPHTIILQVIRLVEIVFISVAAYSYSLSSE